jgi:hypothetical protein
MIGFFWSHRYNLTSKELGIFNINIAERIRPNNSENIIRTPHYTTALPGIAALLTPIPGSRDASSKLLAFFKSTCSITARVPKAAGGLSSYVNRRTLALT